MVVIGHQGHGIGHGEPMIDSLYYFSRKSQRVQNECTTLVVMQTMKNYWLSLYKMEWKNSQTVKIDSSYKFYV